LACRDPNGQSNESNKVQVKYSLVRIHFSKKGIN
jgi:hypothetical protein